ncbi:MAG: hypothetical protein Ct9H300mP12_14600 [Acidimicrobiales bacterium]|nr:MAG: hypothetical protein Ct9H300mP12_14600 [Acidimicrobiales bacterium]
MNVRVVVVLGQIGYVATAAEFDLRPRPTFGPRGRGPVRGRPYDPVLVPRQQQNTFTGRLTEPMFDAVLRRAVELAGR